MPPDLAVGVSLGLLVGIPWVVSALRNPSPIIIRQRCRQTPARTRGVTP